MLQQLQGMIFFFKLIFHLEGGKNTELFSNTKDYS